MRIETFGDANAPNIMLLPGTCCNWRGNFGESVELLAKDFHVICVDYDGFDGDDDIVFPGMVEETVKIEDYIIKNCAGQLFAAYGSSLGGSFVGLLIQRRRVHLTHGILGSSDLDQGSKLMGKIQGGLMVPLLYRAIHTGVFPDAFKKWLASMYNAGEMERVLACFGIEQGGNPHIKKESIYNQYYTDLITKLDDAIEVKGTTVHCFYAKGMGEKYLKRYYRHFKDPDIAGHDMSHEQLLISHPQQWVAEVKRVTGVA